MTRPALLRNHVVGAGLLLMLAPGCRTTAKTPGNPFWISQRRSCPEPYTIWCIDFRGPEHRIIIENLAMSLRKRLEPKKVKVVHEDAKQISTLYYGEYCPAGGGKLFPRDSQARRDLKTIKSLASRQGRYPFMYARLLPVPLADAQSLGPPEWNLCNARKQVVAEEGALICTLAIGVYHDHPDRKKFAVDAVRTLRREEKVDAYYYHYPNKSLVTVGIFVIPAEDLRRQQGGNPQPVFTDPKLKEYIKRFPYWLDNGEGIRRVVPAVDQSGKPVKLQGEQWYERSQVMEVPNCEGGQP